MSRIPKILHYTFGMAPDFGGKPWSLVHHVCVASAVARIKPEKVFFYCEFEPHGPWWELTRGLVTLVKIQAPREIFGRPLVHYAHRSDVVRLQKLIEHGGIYLDADVLVQRSFDTLLDHSTVLGREGVGAKYGMANAVMLAEPNAPFLRRWLASYQSFRSKGKDQYWGEHSVALPARLAAEHADEITVLSEKAFFWPLWTEEDLDWIFRSNRPIPLEECYANHLWEAQAWPHLEDLTPGVVRQRGANFSAWARPFIADLPDDYGAPSIGRRLQKFSRRTSDDFNSGRDRAVRRLRNAAGRWRRGLMTEAAKRRQTFQDVYKYKQWGGEDEERFFSGIGSRGSAAEEYVNQIVALIENHCHDSPRRLKIVDLGCGDFQVGRALLSQLPAVDYLGCDIVPELVAHNTKLYSGERVEFRQIDIVADALPPGDICLVRQVLQHLSNAEIAKFLPKTEAYDVVYVTEGQPADRVGPVNPDKVAGADVRFDWCTGKGRGVELSQPPFGARTQEMFRTFAPPSEVIITERLFRCAAAD